MSCVSRSWIILVLSSLGSLCCTAVQYSQTLLVVFSPRLSPAPLCCPISPPDREWKFYVSELIDFISRSTYTFIQHTTDTRRRVSFCNYLLLRVTCRCLTPSMKLSFIDLCLFSSVTGIGSSCFTSLQIIQKVLPPLLEPLQ